MGAGGLVRDDDRTEAWGMFQAALMCWQGGRVAGGSDEIPRDVIADPVPGLPPDIRADKTMALDQVPTGRR